MRVHSMTWYLCAIEACDVILNPVKPVSSTSASKFQPVCLLNGFFLCVMGFPLLCSLSRSNQPAHMLSGLTEQLHGFGNRVEWPCLYAGLTLPFTAIQSILLTPYCETTHQSFRASPSLPSLRWSSLCQPPDLTIYLSLMNGLCCWTKVKEKLYRMCLMMSIYHSSVRELLCSY